MKKIRIKSCWSGNVWYSKFINRTFNVVEATDRISKDWWKIVDECHFDRYILKDDCEIEYLTKWMVNGEGEEIIRDIMMTLKLSSSEKDSDIAYALEKALDCFKLINKKE